MESQQYNTDEAQRKKMRTRGMGMVAAGIGLLAGLSGGLASSVGVWSAIGIGIGASVPLWGRGIILMRNGTTKCSKEETKVEAENVVSDV